MEMIRSRSKAFHGDDVPVAGDVLLKSAGREAVGPFLVRLLFQDGYCSVFVTAATLLTHKSTFRAGGSFSALV